MKIISKNKRAKFDYEILKEYVAGIKLQGQEVKSAKNGQFNIQGAYVVIRGHEPFLINSHIPPWVYANRVSLAGYDPERPRKLLLKKKEILEIYNKRKTLKAVVVALSVFEDRGLIKLKIALARPLKKYDKERRRKEREEKLKIQRIKRTYGAQ